MDAWLTFLISDQPEQILALIDAFPEFRSMYQDIYELCRNVEGVMGMFSKELLELDRNTTKFMIDELSTDLDTKKAQLKQISAQLEETSAQLEETSAQLVYSQRIQELYSQLSKNNRMDDLRRALNDEEFRNELLKEY